MHSPVKYHAGYHDIHYKQSDITVQGHGFRQWEIILILNHQEWPFLFVAQYQFITGHPVKFCDIVSNHARSKTMGDNSQTLVPDSEFISH